LRKKVHVKAKRTYPPAEKPSQQHRHADDGDENDDLISERCDTDAAEHDRLPDVLQRAERRDK
jgi:hypothetical protein